MTLRAGTMLGSDELLALLGAEAMGRVYCPHDTRLNRDIAVKILPSTFADDVDRLGRFESRELASLNHPNTAAIYGAERISDGRRIAGAGTRSSVATRRSRCGRIRSLIIEALFKQTGCRGDACMPRYVSATVGVLCLVLVPIAADAQTAIACGQTLPGNITLAGQQHLYFQREHGRSRDRFGRGHVGHVAGAG